MADEIESALAAMEDKAPLTPEPGDEGFQPTAPPTAQSAPPVAEQPAGAAPKAPDVPEIEALRQRLADIEKRATDKEGQAAAERARRRQAEAQAIQYRQQVEQFQQQMAAARERAQMRQIPDPEENVVEALKYERALRLRNEQMQQQRMQQQAQVNQQMQFVNQLKSTVEDFEAEFRDKNPEYDDAANYLVDTEQKRLEMAGVPTPQAEQMAINWAVNMASMMVNQGKNPAQVAWEAAQMIGWKPKGAAGAGGQSAATNAFAAAAAGGQTLMDAQAKLAAQQAGQAAARTMGGGGVANNDAETLSAGLSLKGAAFDSWAEKFLRG